jgi:endo-1,4-beta-mannosidase
MNEQQIEHIMNLVTVIGSGIQKLGGIPSGYLYAQMMDMVSIDEYQLVLATLVKLKVISVKNHYITWIGPALSQSVTH